LKPWCEASPSPNGCPTAWRPGSRQGTRCTGGSLAKIGNFNEFQLHLWGEIIEVTDEVTIWVNFIVTELVVTEVVVTEAWNHGNRLRGIIPFYGLNSGL